MKRAALTMALLAAAWSLSAQQDGRKQFDLYGGSSYRGTGSPTLKVTLEGLGLVVSGTASGVTPGGGGGYVIESRENLELSGCETLVIKVSGIDDKTDRYNMKKLLKLEINKRPVQTVTQEMRNRNDLDYISARDGEAEFNISNIRNIRNINLVFFDCTMGAVRIEMFYK